MQKEQVIRWFEDAAKEAVGHAYDDMLIGWLERDDFFVLLECAWKVFPGTDTGVISGAHLTDVRAKLEEWYEEIESTFFEAAAYEVIRRLQHRLLGLAEKARTWDGKSANSLKKTLEEMHRITSVVASRSPFATCVEHYLDYSEIPRSGMVTGIEPESGVLAVDEQGMCLVGDGELVVMPLSEIMTQSARTA